MRVRASYIKWKDTPRKNEKEGRMGKNAKSKI